MEETFPCSESMQPKAEQPDGKSTVPENTQTCERPCKRQMAEIQEQLNSLEKKLDSLTELTDTEADEDLLDLELETDLLAWMLGTIFVLAPIICGGISLICNILGGGLNESLLCITIGLVLILMVPSDSPYRRICRWLDQL